MKSKKTNVKLLKKLFPEISNRIAQLLFDDNVAVINDQDIKINYEKAREILSTSNYYPNFPAQGPVNVIYEDQDTLIVHKQSGIAIEPEGILPGLVNYVTFYIFHKSSNPFDIPRPVHRLDKDTEGLIIFSKNLLAHNYYSKLFKKHDLRKFYTATVAGDISAKLTTLPFKIESYISEKPKNRRYYSTTQDNGKKAITVINKFSYDKKAHSSQLQIEILTGRTHQIRVHLSELGFPIIGDRVYGHEDATGLRLKSTGIEIISYQGDKLDIRL